jgi:hypothetical protein
MASSSATTVTEYLDSLPSDRRAALAAVRDVVSANLPDGYVEGMLYGMIGWYVPLERYPNTYNGQPLGVAALASQKNYNALYLTSVYGDPTLERWFKQAYADAGKKLDMGKSCVRWKTLDALPLDVIGETIRKVPLEAFIARYEAVKGDGKPKSARATRSAAARKSKSTARSKVKSKAASKSAAKAKSKSKRK